MSNNKDSNSPWIINPLKSTFDSAFIGQLDRTWAVRHFPKVDYPDLYESFNYRFVDGYHVLDKIDPERIHEDKQDWKVTYRYNSDWFRCDQFTKTHNGLHVVFSGCSNTEGVGNDIENTWSHMVYKELSKTYNLSGYFNIGKGGYGWHKIINNFVAYVREYGAPDILAILHPNLIRYYVWEESNDGSSQWAYRQKFPYHTQNIKEDGPMLSTVEEHRDEFPVWATSWNLFLEYCKSIGTKVVWSIWDEYEAANIDNSEYFDDTFFTFENNMQEVIEELRPDLIMKDGDVCARDGHPGLIEQTWWSKQFLKQINNKIMGDNKYEVYKKNN